MSIEQPATSTVAPVSGIFAGPEDRTAASYERQLAENRDTEMRLRDEMASLDPDAEALKPKETARAFADRELKRREEEQLAAEELAKKKTKESAGSK